MQKVRLPREVAEALDHMKYIGWHNIIESVVNWDKYEMTTQLSNVRDYFKSDWRILAEALVNGYEIEETTEEKVRSYYETLIRERDRTDIRKGVCHAATLTARIDTLMEVLHMQGTTYKGVNDNGEN